MKIIYNHLIPFPGFSAMMLFGVIFARKSARPLSERTERHENIHLAQVGDFRKDGEKTNFRAYFRYYWTYLKQIQKYGYRNSPFEREAYAHDSEPDYLERREPGAWKQYFK